MMINFSKDSEKSNILYAFEEICSPSSMSEGVFMFCEGEFENCLQQSKTIYEKNHKIKKDSICKENIDKLSSK